MSTAAVILAADRGDGFAGPKYSVLVRGTPMLERVVADASMWPVDEVIVVLGADADAIEDACDLTQVSLVIDPEWDEGSASPLRAVLDLLSRDRNIERCVLARGDQPGVGAEIVGPLVDTAISSGAEAVIPKYRYAQGWPLVVSAALWDVFLGLEGEVNVLDVLTNHALSIEEVWLDHLPTPTLSSPGDIPSPRR
jgi:molybdenum cofactor cytidylyltransferase